MACARSTSAMRKKALSACTNPMPSRLSARATAPWPLQELQAERCPGRDPEVAQPEFVIDEVEVVVQALARLGAQVGLAAALVVPRLVARAGLHRRYHVHQPGCIATRLHHACHQIFLPDWALFVLLDLDAGGSADLLR